VNLYDWLLFLHVLGAFAAVASVVVFTVLLLAGESTPGALRLAGLGRRLWDAGGGVALVLGVWLALHVKGYDLLDGWILAAFVLWAVAAGSSVRLAGAYGEPGDRRPLLLWAVMTLAVVALLADMIFKPGA
jgi:hypothetical protein